MCFAFLGQVVRRTWPFLLVGWGVLLLATRLAAPPWEEVAQDREFGFLPPDSPSRLAQDVYAKAFPSDPLGSNLVLVVHRTFHQPGPLDVERKLIEDVLEPGLRRIADAEGGLAGEAVPSDEPLFRGEGERPPEAVQRSIIARIRTPNAPGTGSLLVSPDGQALLVVLELTTEFLSNRNWATIAKVEELVRELERQGRIPPSVDLSVTGSAVVGRDHTWAQIRSARATELLTVVLVIVLLLLLYRAPLLALIPLATVYLAVQVSLNLLAILAGAGLVTLFQGIQVYITILSYGAGVDYCLFLTARYREGLDSGAPPADAVAGAVGGVGAALAASAATVICGIGMMMFAEFGKFREAGFAIPLSLVVVLCATLTFSPALLRLAGRWAFWPQPYGQAVDDQSAAGRWTAFIRVGGLGEVWERLGRVLLRRAGAVWLATVALMAPFAVIAGLFYDRLNYDLIVDLPNEAPSGAGTRLLQEHFPAGVTGPVTVLLVNPGIDFGSEQGRALVGRLTEGLRERKGKLMLADVRSLTAPLGITEQAARDSVGLDLPVEVRREAAEQLAHRRYLTDLGERGDHGTRLDLVLGQGPFAQQSVEDLDRIEQAIRSLLPPESAGETQLYLIGTTASVRDLAAVMRRDRVRIEILVLGSVLVILVLLLRRVVVSLYLLLSVLFSYYATLGVAFVVFWLLDPQGFTGIDWRVAIFLFTILIAVGEDYNIFLMTRVDEEARSHGPIRGVTRALARTGPVISSCGVIMAGTFASLLSGSLMQMKQLGFALAFGVLLDTFVVRPILVPAFLIWLRGVRPGLVRRGGVGPLPPSAAARPHRSAGSPSP